MNLLLPDHLTGQELRTLSLPHPRNGDDCLFLKAGDSVYEAVKFNRSIGCLFVDDAVVSDASLSIITPVDPLFLLLPNLIKNEKQFRSVTDLFEDTCDHLKQLARHCSRLFQHVCDEKVVDDETYLRYSEERTMAWLQHKVNCIIDVLDKKNVSTSTTSVGMDKLKFLGKSGSCRADQLRYASGLVEEYLPLAVIRQLRAHLSISDDLLPPDSLTADSKAAVNTDAKVNPNEDYYVDPKYGMKVEEPKLSRSQKQLAKVDKKGIRPISSFFSKK